MTIRTYSERTPWGTEWYSGGQVMAYFRSDNTQGYSAVDLAALNEAMGYIASANERWMDKSAVDHAMAEVLALYDQGLRGSDIIQAWEYKNPWPFPPSYLTANGPVR